MPRYDMVVSVLAAAHFDAAVASLATPGGPDDVRSYEQRLADAVGRLAKRALDAGDLPEVAAQRPHVIPIASDSGSPAEIDGIGAVSDATADQVRCDAGTDPGA